MTRKPMIVGLVALGVLAAGAAHALPEGWFVTHSDSHYRCAGNQVPSDPAAHRLLATVVIGHLDIRGCEAMCEARSGCVAFSFVVQFSASGVESNICQLYSTRDTRHTARFEGGRFDYAAICYRDRNSIERALQYDTRVDPGLTQYTLRPGSPGTAIPNTPAPHKH